MAAQDTNSDSLIRKSEDPATAPLQMTFIAFHSFMSVIVAIQKWPSFGIVAWQFVRSMRVDVTTLWRSDWLQRIVELHLSGFAPDDKETSVDGGWIRKYDVLCYKELYASPLYILSAGFRRDLLSATALSVYKGYTVMLSVNKHRACTLSRWILQNSKKN